MNSDMQVTLDSGGGSEVLCLDEVKDLLQVEHDYDNDRLRLANRTATEALSGHAWMQLLSAVRTLRLPDIPSRVIYLPYPPLTAINSVKYYDLDETLQTIDASNYIVHTWHQPGVLQLRDEYALPDLAPRLDAFQIAFTCGYASAAAVPHTIKEALHFLIKYLYEHPDMMGVCSDESRLPGYYRMLLATFCMRDERVLHGQV